MIRALVARVSRIGIPTYVNERGRTTALCIFAPRARAGRMGAS